MPEPLKNLYTKELINSLCCAITAEYPAFDTPLFTALIFDSEWQGRELKDRMKRISEVLNLCLPMTYIKSLEILKPVAEQFSGFQYMFFPGYVELYGFAEPGSEVFLASMDALEYFTAFSSSEFAVRPFLKAYPIAMMLQMTAWASSENEHIRRLASEGCRPRLPWAMALPDFKFNPSSVLALLVLLRYDSSEYVRKSVANNLNDISKDHPDEVVNIAKAWLGETKNLDRLVKHGCRTLLKQGGADVLTLFGFTDPSHIGLSDFNLQESLEIGESLSFSFQLNTNQVNIGKLRLEFAIDFMKSKGKTSKKVFSISESNCDGQFKIVKKKHPFKIISTRTYYPGLHRLAIIVNGKEMIAGNFNLINK